MKKIFYVLFCFAIVIALINSCSSNNNSNALRVKATKNYYSAIKSGNLNQHQSNEYLKGLKYIQKSGQRIGELTIGEVISQQEGREISVVSHTKIQPPADLNKVQANLKSALEFSNHTLGYEMYTSYSVTNNTCEITINADYYENASGQDKEIINRTVTDMCVGSFTLLGGTPLKLPENGLTIRLLDLNGNGLFHNSAFRHD